MVLLLIPIAVSAIITDSFDDPYGGKGLSDNFIIDIITHKGAVWMATGRGVSYQYFGDLQWNKYDTTNGMPDQDISAIYSDSVNGVLWVGLNYYSENDAYADGLAFTTNEGFTWDKVVPEGTSGVGKTVFDITGYDNTLFAAAFYGGLVGSFDGGQNWKHIYFSREDSIDYVDGQFLSLRNRYFSAVLDTFHQDSVVLWTGTADGIVEYIYAPPYTKLFSNYIFDIASVDSFVYICGDSSLTRLKFDTAASGSLEENYHSAFVDDGLPGMAVTTACGLGGRLFVGTLDSVGGVGMGMAISDDNGLSFHTGHTGLDDMIGENRYPVEFASVTHNLFVAGLEGGLYMSSDSGAVWQKLYLDPLDTTLANPRNVANALAADSHNLWVGTDSGLVVLFLDSAGMVDSSSNFTFVDNDTAGARSVSIGIQKFADTLGNVDSTIIWTVNYPLDTLVGEYSVYYTNDYGATWFTRQGDLTGIHYYDIGFLDEIIYLLREDGFRYSNNRTSWLPYDGSQIRDSVDWSKNLDAKPLNCVLNVNDTLYFGSRRGLAISPAGTINWHLVIANTDATMYDLALNYRAPYLTGDFVNALGIQYLPDNQSRIWASTRKTFDPEVDGVTSSTLDGQDWEHRLDSVRCWNFAFYGPQVFAATSEGLFHSADTGRNWDRRTISGVQVTSDPPVDYGLDPATEVQAVRVVGEYLWVGTADGAARINLNQIYGEENWDIYRVYDSSFELYAYPTPFSHAEDSRLLFHYYVPEDAYVTIEVYDFAMDLVRTVVNGEFRVRGIYNTDQWDGFNGRGYPVAVGMYYFKLTLSSGKEHWGKLVIIP
ncbi:MAG: hypothetical protein JSU69_08425 [Candidatus Zixiibacteriota bacterium]|nr:MAG: hypothetical protein JSU69_08425 [candidate division Zixibacteria bacterium]